jgi:hypothetical protein
MSSCLLLLPLCLLGTGDDSVPLKELGISLPKKLANFEYLGTKEFKPKALGYSVGYGNARCQVTLYVYDFDQKGIPAGKDGQAVKDQLQRSVEDVRILEKQGRYKNVEQLKDTLPLSKTVLNTFAAAGFAFDFDGKRCKSYILLTGHSGYFVKVRVTQYVVDNQTNDEEMAAFLEAVEKKLNPAPK